MLSRITFTSKPSGWTTEVLKVEKKPSALETSSPENEQDAHIPIDSRQYSQRRKTKSISDSKWPSVLSKYLTIERVTVLNEDECEQTVFTVGSPLKIQMAILRISFRPYPHFEADVRLFLPQFRTGLFGTLENPCFKFRIAAMHLPPLRLRLRAGIFPKSRLGRGDYQP